MTAATTTFVEVPVGTYRLEFDLTGFKKNVRRGVTLDINQVITLNMTMQLGASQEVVDVTSEAPLVETTQHAAGRSRGDRAVSELAAEFPRHLSASAVAAGRDVDRRFEQLDCLWQQQAGAVSVNGGRGRSNNFNVNGGDANDQFANLPTVQPSPDSIQEFRVLTNTFDAEYGRNSGSVVNVVTKSGTNQFHGNVYEFFRNKVLNANDYCLSADGCPKAAVQSEPVWRNVRWTRSRRTTLSSSPPTKAAGFARESSRPRSRCRRPLERPSPTQFR